MRGKGKEIRGSSLDILAVLMTGGALFSLRAATQVPERDDKASSRRARIRYHGVARNL